MQAELRRAAANLLVDPVVDAFLARVSEINKNEAGKHDAMMMREKVPLKSRWTSRASTPMIW